MRSGTSHAPTCGSTRCATPLGFTCPTQVSGNLPRRFASRQLTFDCVPGAWSLTASVSLVAACHPSGSQVNFPWFRFHTGSTFSVRVRLQENCSKTKNPLSARFVLQQVILPNQAQTLVFLSSSQVQEVLSACCKESSCLCDSGHWGSPTFGVGAFIGMLAATIASVVESVGDYSTTATACQVNRCVKDNVLFRVMPTAGLDTCCSFRCRTLRVTP